MISVDWLFDGALGLLLLALASASLLVRQLYTGVVLFIAFGLLLALTWARLGAPDLALAEAAIGAGLTGALLLAALARVGEFKVPTSTSWITQLPRWLLGLLVLAILLRSLAPLPQGPVVLPDLAHEQLHLSGVEHPVTAVLLNYRAWDTLLELVVLLLALLGVRQLKLSPLLTPKPWPLLLAWSLRLAPLTLMVGGYVLWRGAFAPGGAFQAGALLAAGAVVLRLNGLLPALSWRNFGVRLLVCLGLLAFLLLGSIGFWMGQEWLSYPPAWAGGLILAIEVAATLSIATSLCLLVVGDEKELRA